jgi:hypothetical protein
MLKTTVSVNNAEKIDEILKDLVKASYEEVRDEALLLCMECGDVDIYIAADKHEVLQDAIHVNFKTDEFGDFIERKQYLKFMDDLYEYYLELHVNSGYFDYFPAGFYDVNGEQRESETDMLAPKGLFYAPFDDAKKQKS